MEQQKNFCTLAVAKINQLVNSLCRASVKSGDWVVPGGTRHKELIFYIMDSLGTHFKDIILRDLYCDPRKKRIQYDILDKLQIKLFPEQLISYRKQLVMEELVTEDYPDEIDSPIEVTPKGYELIHLHGSYDAYINSMKQDEELRKESERLQAKYLRLKIYNTVITIFCTIISFIAGILLSGPIKQLWQQL